MKLFSLHCKPGFAYPSGVYILPTVKFRWSDLFELNPINLAFLKKILKFAPQCYLKWKADDKKYINLVLKKFPNCCLKKKDRK